MSGSVEHLLVLTAFAFPPLLIIVILTILLASFGKSLGLRERYINTLIRIFEWGAGEIRERQQEERRKESQANLRAGFHLENSEDEEEDDSLDVPEVGSYCSLELDDLPKGSTSRSMGYGSMSSPSLGRRQHGSQASLGSTHSTTSTYRNRHSSGQGIIARGAAIHIDEDEYLQQSTFVHSRGWQAVKDSLYFVKAGVEAIIEDEVTSRFQAEQLASWNMLTRTSLSFYQVVNWKVTMVWAIGCFVRYCLMLPLRLMLFSVALLCLLLGTAVVGLLPNGRVKRDLNRRVMLMCCRMASRAFSALIYFHDVQNRATSGGICVANHTSPIDVLILSCDNVYALIGQSHSGFLGMLQRALNRASAHIWFERGAARDRAAVARALREHVDDPHKLPILVFPEGTCINNTSVMMFKKGSFEIGTRIYPIAMKYDSRFSDAFWNSAEQGYLEYIMQMMTSWAIICHVWYLPPMERLPGESAIDFANRVKKTIAVRGGLVDLEWDGQLKREKVPARLLAKQQAKYSRRLRNYASCSEPTDTELDGDNGLSDLDEHREEDEKENERTLKQTSNELKPSVRELASTPMPITAFSE